jgi:hypothetical protein
VHADQIVVVGNVRRHGDHSRSGIGPALLDS